MFQLMTITSVASPVAFRLACASTPAGAAVTSTSVWSEVIGEEGEGVVRRTRRMSRRQRDQAQRILIRESLMSQTAEVKSPSSSAVPRMSAIQSADGTVPGAALGAVPAGVAS